MNLAVGFFDGVHVGHQRILAHADAALTFTNHPATVFAPDRAPRLLMTTEERLAAISVLGVRRVIARDFTSELAAQSPGEFAASLRRDFPIWRRCTADPTGRSARTAPARRTSCAPLGFR